MQLFINFFQFSKENLQNGQKNLKLAKICPKNVRIPDFLVGRRPTTDLFHVLAWLSDYGQHGCGLKAHTRAPHRG